MRRSFVFSCYGSGRRDKEMKHRVGRGDGPWKPFSEAPKDGSSVLLRGQHQTEGVAYAVAFYDKRSGGWEVNYGVTGEGYLGVVHLDIKPTHFCEIVKHGGDSGN
jgi:hypothetical protein